MDAHSEPAGAGIAPAGFAVGVTVTLVGVVVSPLVLVPLGAVVAVGSAVAWVRSNRGSGSVETDAGVDQEIDRAELGERYPRNRFLERATLALGGVVAAGIGLPAAGFAVLPSFLGQRKAPIDLGPISAFPEGEYIVATFLSDARAGEVSRRAAYVRNNGLVSGQPSFTIMSSRCTHVGCPTQPNGPIFGAKRTAAHTSSGEIGLVPTLPGGFGCPCHGSQFDTEGNRTAGPAPRALDRYEFSIRNDHLVLGRLVSVSRVDGVSGQARIHEFALQGAGQPVSGIESWLYPLAPPS